MMLVDCPRGFVCRAAAVAVALCAASAAQAVVVVNEPFDYSIGSTLRHGVSNGGTGWARPWRVEQMPANVGPVGELTTLTRPGARPTNGALGMSGTIAPNRPYIGVAYREFPLITIGVEPVWLSFDYRGTGLGESMTVGLLGTVGVRASADGRWYLNGGGVPPRSGAGPRVSSTRFDNMVMTLRRVGTRMEAALYVNPGAGSTPFQTANLPLNEGISNLSVIYAGTTGTMQTGYLDNIRIGRGRWEPTGGVPTPGAVSVVALGAVVAWRRRRG